MQVIFMDRKQAEDLLKEILDNCPALNGSTITLMPPESSDVPSKGYQIHIKPVPNEEVLCCLRGIAEKHNIALRQEKQLLSIYEPLTS